MNLVTLIGNLGAAPILRTTPSGTPILTFKLAVDDRVVRDDMVEHRTDWIPVVVWGRNAEICATHLQKGSQVAVEGSLRSRLYQDRDQQNYVLECVAKNVKFLAKIKSKEIGNDIG